MKIEAVCVSVDYADILEQVLPYNIPHFDNLVIVTTPEDTKTQNVCRKFGVDCLKTNVFYRNGAKFDKSAAINYGLANLGQKDWLVQIDSDIILPIHFRKFLANAELSSLNIYGIDRVDIDSFAKFQEWKNSGELQYEWSCLIKPPNRFPLGARIAHGSYGGFCPLGFTQIWHADSGITRYPTGGSSTAEHGDILHAIQWNRSRRILIPEMFAIHLCGSTVDGDKKMGINWAGRKSKTFSEKGEPYELSKKNPPIVTKGAYELNFPNYGGVATK